MEWSRILFPIWEDFLSINNDKSGTLEEIMINNLNLSNNKEEYKKFILELNKEREEKIKDLKI